MFQIKVLENKRYQRAVQSAKPKVQIKGTKTVLRRQCMQKEYERILTKITNWYKKKREEGV